MLDLEHPLLCTMYSIESRSSRRVPLVLLPQRRRLADRTFGTLASERGHPDILSKQKILVFHYFMHMRAKTICGFYRSVILDLFKKQVLRSLD